MPPRNAMIDAMANALDTGVGAQGVMPGSTYDPRLGSDSPINYDALIVEGTRPTDEEYMAGLLEEGYIDSGNWRQYGFPPMNIGLPGRGPTPAQAEAAFGAPGSLPVGYPPNASGYYVSGKETDEYIPFYSDEKGLAGVVPYANDREFVPSPDHTGTQVSVPVSHGGPDGSQASCPVGYTYDPEVGACVMQGVSEKMQGLEGQNKMELIRNPELLKIFLQKMTPAKPSQGMPPVPEGLRGMLGTQTPQQAPQLPQQMSEAPQQGRQG